MGHENIVDLIKQRGVPERWQRLGWLLSKVGALSTHLVEAAQEAHESRSAEAQELVNRLFDEQVAALTDARVLLADSVQEYEAAGRWQQLDRAFALIDVDEIISSMRGHFGLHPAPLVLESVKFNLTFAQEHGFRAFYEMTAEYLRRVAEVLSDGRTQSERSDMEGPFPSWALFHLDLTAIEVPLHCDVCRMAITIAEYACEDVSGSAQGSEADVRV
jgi:hypothetical protein